MCVRGDTGFGVRALSFNGVATRESVLLYACAAWQRDNNSLKMKSDHAIYMHMLSSGVRSPERGEVPGGSASLLACCDGRWDKSDPKR